MATYKLIQDIEAEDHILGPLTLRQFIYALIAALCFYLSFFVFTKGAKILVALFLPPGLFCLFFAIPFGTQQSTEVWALAKIRYYIKPRRRVWDQSGAKELVTITAPKKVEIPRTNGLSQTEVNSRLQALANTIDSRGWAIKNVNINAFSQPNPLAAMDSDRLIDMSSLPQEVPAIDVLAQDDILDETSNPLAQQFQQMMNEAATEHRNQIISELQQAPAPKTAAAPTNSQSAQPPADYWFLNQPARPDDLPPGQAIFSSPSVVAPGAQSNDTVTLDESEAELAAELKAKQQTSYNRMRTLRPASDDVADSSAAPAAPAPQAAAPATPAPTVTPPSDPAILSLAHNDDLNVATLAREAHKARGDEPPQEEVVISLR